MMGGMKKGWAGCHPSSWISAMNVISTQNVMVVDLAVEAKDMRDRGSNRG